MTGAAVLAALVRLCTGPTDDPRLIRAASVAELRELLAVPEWSAGSSDVTSALGKLAYEHLAHRSPAATIRGGRLVQIRRPVQVYTPTDRGRAVAALLASGKKPVRASGLSPSECQALR